MRRRTSKGSWTRSWVWRRSGGSRMVRERSRSDIVRQDTGRERLSPGRRRAQSLGPPRRCPPRGASPLMFRLLALTVALAAMAGCQNYDLEPVTPLGLRTVHVNTAITHIKARPDLMLMVDRSGSMAQPIDPTNPACTPGCN